MHKYPDTIRIPRIVVCFLRIEYSSSIYAKYPDTLVSLGSTAGEDVAVCLQCEAMVHMGDLARRGGLNISHLG